MKKTQKATWAMIDTIVKLFKVVRAAKKQHSKIPELEAALAALEGSIKPKHVCDNSCEDTGHLVLERKEAEKKP